MIKVRPKPDEKIERTLRRFKKLCENEGILRDYRRHEYYESRSEIRRRKRHQAQRRREKEARDLKLGIKPRKDESTNGGHSVSFDM